MQQQVGQAAVQAVRDNPELQQAVADEAVARGQELGGQAQAAYCVSLRLYFEEISKLPACGTLLSCRPEDWKEYYANHNYFFCQLMFVGWFVFVGFSIASWFSLSTEDGANGVLASLAGIGIKTLTVIVIFLFTHMAWFYIYQREGCCGNGGCCFAMWFFMYIIGFAILVVGTFQYIAGTQLAAVLGQWLAFLPTLWPTICISVALWKMGGGATINSATSATVGAVKAGLEMKDEPAAPPGGWNSAATEGNQPAAVPLQDTWANSRV